MTHISSQQVMDNIKKTSLYYQEIMMQLMKHPLIDLSVTDFYDKDKANEIVVKIVEQFFEHPEKFTNTNLVYIQNLQKLIADSMAVFRGEKSNEEHENKPVDRRFKNEAWEQSIYFDFIKKYYIISSEWIENTVNQYHLDPDGKRFLEFTSTQFIEAMSPSNFIFSNPEVIRESLDSGMDNIARGMKNFLSDIKKSSGLMKISTTDKSSFRIGKNLATTKGKVIFQNELIQLICYEPKDKTYKIPLFVIPPWINKYYILDLSENNSMMKWLVDNNFQVFLVSWVNPNKKLSNTSFEDYLRHGVVEPLEYLKTIGVDQVNALGYCIGGTLLAIALSYYKNVASKFAATINSATFLTTLVDFSNPGDIGALINKSTIHYIENKVNEVGYLDGKYLSNSFSLIRANDLVWSYFVNNYLLGKSPAAFDILFWNSDATNLPANMYIYYLKNMYLDNLLIKPLALEMLGVKIDLGNVDVPSFSLAAKSDHIALWQSVYSGVKLFKGDRVFCLTDAGHVAGVVNPATTTKYSHMIGTKITDNPNDWHKESVSHRGSWWLSWRDWLVGHSGSLDKSMNYKSLAMIEEAPGSYVK